MGDPLISAGGTTPTGAMPNVIGYNPEPEIVGGYIADVVIKLNATQSFIEGY